ncbi:MAG: DUF72 domain-containing protein [Thermodesulfobacteriota bacterium]
MPQAYGQKGGPVSGPSRTCRIWVGTSGYSYTQWVQTGFYPPEAKPGRMLSLYAQRFPATELNQTWYQTPQAETMERQRRQVPPSFLFTAKLFRGLTQDPLTGPWRDRSLAYRDGLAPLIQSGQLAAVLVQLPPAFDRSVANRRHLAALLDELEGLPLAVEFRQGSWNTDRVFGELRRRGVTLVAVDEPDLPGLFPALDVITNPDLFYVRFHGRNGRGWRRGGQEVQFDYEYSEAELREWVEKRILKMAVRSGRGVVFFNNHVRGQAPRNALTFARLLKEYGLAVVTP